MSLQFLAVSVNENCVTLVLGETQAPCFGTNVFIPMNSNHKVA